jgi:nitroreductase
MDLKQAIYQRRSTRQFTQAAVSQEDLLALIDAAVQAPSAVNEQPWSFYVVRDRQHLIRLSAEVKDHLLRTSSMAAMAEHVRETRSDPGNDIFHGAPVLLVIASQYDSVWAIEDCALAAANVMLTAHSMGLGTCWIGSAHTYLQTPRGRASLQLESHHRAVAPIIIGHPRVTPPSVARRPADIHWMS